MTDKQIKEMEKTLPRWKNGVPPVLTPQQEILKESLSCRDMINSINISNLLFHSCYCITI